MKMEVLSVQNQFQGQFGVIGSPKVKDWTSPLTPPPSAHNLKYRDTNNVDALTSTVSATANSLSHSASTTSTTTATSLLSSSPSSLYSNTSSTLSEAATASLLSQDDASLHALSLRLQSELRAAKSRHLACTEVLLPADLLHRVAAEMIKVSEKEPCGIKGCKVYIKFEDEPSNTRRIASLKVDPNTVSTFELYLTLKQNKSGWTSILPQFLKNLTRSSTIMISPEFNLTKNKLYHTFE